MTDAEFYKSFSFNLYRRHRYSSTDCITRSGCPMHYIARMVRGTAKFQTASQTVKLKAGDVFYLPRGLKYRSYWYPDGDAVEFYSLGFDYFPCDEHTDYPLQIISCTDDERAVLTAIEADITVTPLSIGKLYTFIGMIQHKLESGSTHANRIVVNTAMEYIRNHTACSVKDIAQHCGISESGLYAKFRQHLNQTPVEARQGVLVDKAIELLYTTDLSIEEISERLGFSSSSYFRKVFRSKTNSTPTAYRKNIKNI